MRGNPVLHLEGVRGVLAAPVSLLQFALQHLALQIPVAQVALVLPLRLLVALEGFRLKVLERAGDFLHGGGLECRGESDNRAPEVGHHLPSVLSLRTDRAASSGQDGEHHHAGGGNEVQGALHPSGNVREPRTQWLRDQLRVQRLHGPE